MYRGLPSADYQPKAASITNKAAAAWEREGRGLVDVFLRPLKYPPMAEFQQGIAKAQEKGVDVHLAVDLVWHALMDFYDVAILVSNDTDMHPAVEKAVHAGKRIEFASWGRYSKAAPGMNGIKFFTHRLRATDYDAVADRRRY